MKVNRSEGLIKEVIKLLISEAKVSGMTAWPNDVLDIPFRSDTDQAQKIGPGERRIAKIVNGRVAGGSVSYDIIDANGNKWEVKAPNDKLEIKTGVEGRAALTPVREEIERVCNVIENAFLSTTANIIVDVLGKDAVHDVAKFVKEDIPRIRAGEISRSRINMMVKIMTLISDLVQEIDASTDSSGEKYVAIGDDGPDIELRVDLPTYIKVSKALDIDNDDINISVVDVLKSEFNSPEFHNPDAWFKKVWVSTIRASQVFGHVDGLFLVSPEGYRLIKKDDIDNVIKFDNVTRGIPAFKVIK